MPCEDAEDMKPSVSVEDILKVKHGSPNENNRKQGTVKRWRVEATHGWLSHMRIALQIWNSQKASVFFVAGIQFLSPKHTGMTGLVLV